MNAAVVCIAGLIIFALGYRFYSRLIAYKVFDLQADEPVPSKELEDGVDFVPSNKHVLFGHHFSSIAGAAPIIGPAIAVVWGWVPAFLWVVLGAVFMGAVHDFSTLVISVRNQGRSIGKIAESVISPRARTLFLLIIFCLVLLVIAVFATAIAGLFVGFPGTVLPVNFEILVALLIGWWCYKKKGDMLWPSLAALVALYVMVWVGTEVPVDLGFVGGKKDQITLWVVLLMIYGFVASILPVWVLLQPRDYINSHQLIVGLGALILGIMVAHPTIQAPAFNAAPEGSPHWFPFLFVTIACGAISGFHGLVSSGTTSKQLACATHARPIGYGAMLGEGVLALIATLAVSAGLADWSSHYDHFPSTKEGVAAFVNGASSFLTALSIPDDAAKIVVGVLVISFAATSLDTGVRIQRYIIQELGETYHIRALRNRYLAGLIAVVPPLILVLSGQERLLWPLFGASNQLLAGLSLVVVTVWLIKLKRPYLYLLIPCIIVLTITTIALVINIANFATGADPQYHLAAVGTLLLALQLWVMFEGALAVRNLRADNTR
jgi:carbon starvation protein